MWRNMTAKALKRRGTDVSCETHCFDPALRRVLRDSFD
jgi:hypothetical protein